MSSNTRIIKNTLFLYFRMFFIMGVSLYTSRVILQVLGVDDFGIYNLVGGIVVLFAFFNSAMSATTQRYINVEITSGLKEQVNKVFCTSLNIHFAIAVIVIFFAETIGLWFLNEHLNIPPERMYAANVVYQISILTTAVGIIRIPYDAIVIAYEKMSYYAFFGIFENLAKLVAVFSLYLFSDKDVLITYAVLLMLITFCSNFIYYLYSIKNFKIQTTYRYYKDRKLYKELISFSGWMVFGQVAVVGASQGLNMILNIFIGVVVNAAMGLANQVNAAVYSFVSNFQIAFRSQLIQSYAEKDIKRHKDLVLNTSKYSLFLMAMLAVPLLYFTDSLLALWLGPTVPSYTADFIRIIILISLVDALAGPFWISAQAIGSIKAYNIVLTAINLLVLPVAFVLLKMGYSPASVLAGKFVISLINQLFRYYFINKYLHFNKGPFLMYFVSVGSVFLFLITLTISGSTGIQHDLYHLIKTTIFLEAILLVLVYFIGLNAKERDWLLKLLRSKIFNKT